MQMFLLLKLVQALNIRFAHTVPRAFVKKRSNSHIVLSSFK
ncbi:hypothetical protein amad1_16845 [Alteromonas mediterranea DE1]|nr:hypothetical protein amad1_16845 [Alteromonas mediterranea DE1]AGP98862.1 hypothetical protein I635_16805 [Alteromonas mediterranea UM7]AGQ03056.1 hypothetical protein I636_16120 [Alteromonas mediterranea UM4b]